MLNEAVESPKLEVRRYDSDLADSEDKYGGFDGRLVGALALFSAFKFHHFEQRDCLTYHHRAPVRHVQSVQPCLDVRAL